ncbi:hypothetical protein AX16_007573 [Volvariella volvacea WC 439]|nr:hypothetical protein AX16_007573 [Volvariella volvacea WC 439]
MAIKYWLLKAEPESRVVKGKDVKFSVDDFEAVKISPWEGVRNYEARNLMKEMKVGDKALFYHSNCKNPGIAAFAQVSKEAYPDYTAWDPNHPYYDAKTDKDNPKWFMVDLTFVARAKHFIPLALLKGVADRSNLKPQEEIRYIGENGVKAIKSMDLVTRGRLSVQRVDEAAWNVIKLLAEQGGWEETDFSSTKKSRSKKAADVNVPAKKVTAAEPKSRTKAVKRSRKKTGVEDSEHSDINQGGEGHVEEAGVEVESQSKKRVSAKKAVGQKRKSRKDTAEDENVDRSQSDGDDGDYGTRRRSKRTRK